MFVPSSDPVLRDASSLRQRQRPAPGRIGERFKLAARAADATGMARTSRVRTIALAIAGAVALAGVTGASSLTGHHGDVAHASAIGSRTPIPGVAAAAVHRAHDASGTTRAAAPTTRPARHAKAPDRARRRRARAPKLLVRMPTAMAVRAHPAHEARVIGTLPASSKYYHVALTAWVEKVSANGRWGRVEIPYVWPRTAGWIPLHGLRRSQTHVEVHVDLSKHWVTVTKFGKVVAGFRAATGASSSPTPPGSYFVTDRIPFYAGSALGSFAFGISGIQPHLPAGWSGGNQLAIHGTNDPASIGTSQSAGCVRVSERALHTLRPLLRLGTPVVIGP
jgi:lipoprotein-anchoring transpeptidase ErfK/SrfK